MSEITRYSDVVPYEQRKYWYLTSHGIGPGTIPKDLKLLDVISAGGSYDFICLDGILNTSELNYYDVKEQFPPEDAIVCHYLDEKNIRVEDVWLEDGKIIIIVVDESIEFHKRVDVCLAEIGYTKVVEETDNGPTPECYSAKHVYRKED